MGMEIFWWYITGQGDEILQCLNDEKLGVTVLQKYDIGLLLAKNEH